MITDQYFIGAFLVISILNFDVIHFEAVSIFSVQFNFYLFDVGGTPQFFTFLFDNLLNNYH